MTCISSQKVVSGLDLRPTRCFINTFGVRSFAAAGARQWSSLPSVLRPQDPS